MASKYDMAQLESPAPKVVTSTLAAPPPALAPPPVQVVRHEFVMVPPPPTPRDNWYLEHGGLTASAAVIASAIAGTIAWYGIKAARDNLARQMDDQRKIAQKVARASVVSANRQKWIDAIRDDLAELITADDVMLEHSRTNFNNVPVDDREKYKERVGAARAKVQLMHRRIQLRLNPSKPTHEALMRAVDTLIAATDPDHRNARNGLIEGAQSFLRHEWLRLKQEAGDWDSAIMSSPEIAVRRRWFGRILHRS